MDVGKLNTENLAKANTWVVQSNSTTVEKMLLDRFKELENEMRSNYLLCQVKLHIYGVIALCMVYYFK